MKCFTGPLNLPAVWTFLHRSSQVLGENLICVCVRHLQTTGNLAPSSDVQLHVLTVIPVLCFWCVPHPKKKKTLLFFYFFFFLLKCMSHLSGFIIASDISLGSHCHFTQHCFGEICSWERPVPVPRIMSSVTSSPHINPGSSMYRDQSSPSWEKPQNASQILRDVNTTRSSLPTSVQTRPICLSTSAVDLLKFLAPPSGPTRKWRFLQPR